jgi:hypothetical protein
MNIIELFKKIFDELTAEEKKEIQKNLGCESAEAKEYYKIIE